MGAALVVGVLPLVGVESMFGLGVVAADTLDGTGVVDVPSLGVKSAFGLAVIDVVGDRLVGTAVSSSVVPLVGAALGSSVAPLVGAALGKHP